MLFYFTGTGNSEFVAITLSNFLNEERIFIPEAEVTKFSDCNDQKVNFVFPVYSWGVPPLIGKFMESLPSTFWASVEESGVDVNCVMVCGDEVAMAPEMFEGMLKKVNARLHSVWSVIMPNNYVLLPGFDVDSKELEQSKLDSCKGRIMEIAQGIQRGDMRIDVTRGSFPRLKTRLVYPLFKRWGIFPKKWRYGSECISCGKCAAACPICNVTMENGHPQWGNRCCSCLACYHVCPVHAVEYGKVTQKKGQYLFPLKKISSRHCRK